MFCAPFTVERRGRGKSRDVSMSAKAQSPPYPSAARIADSDCYPQYTASLKCNCQKSQFTFYIHFCLKDFLLDLCCIFCIQIWLLFIFCWIIVLYWVCKLFCGRLRFSINYTSTRRGRNSLLASSRFLLCSYILRKIYIRLQRS